MGWRNACETGKEKQTERDLERLAKNERLSSRQETAVVVKIIFLERSLTKIDAAEKSIHVTEEWRLK